MQKTVLITGANKGIGFETARQLGLLGFRIFLSGRDEARLAAAAGRLHAQCVEATTLPMDVADPASIRHAADQFAALQLPLDVLINNAGILSGDDRSLLAENEDVQRRTLDTNSLGPLRVCRAFLPHLRQPGRIIMISSGGGSMTDPVGGWAPAYCVSKSLLNAITRQLAHELSGRQISVNAACPGWVRTDMGGAGAPRTVEKGAETPVWLASEAPQHLTGQFFRDKKPIPW